LIFFGFLDRAPVFGIPPELNPVRLIVV